MDEERERFARRGRMEAYDSDAAAQAFSTVESSSSRADLDLRHDGRVAGEQWRAAPGERERGVDKRRSEQAPSRGSPSRNGDSGRGRADWADASQAHRRVDGDRGDFGGRGEEQQFAGSRQELDGSNDGSGGGAENGSRERGGGNAGGSDADAGYYDWAGRKRSLGRYEGEDGSGGPGPKKVNGDAVENPTRRSSSYS